MSQEMMNTKELARYLHINEKQVYALIKAKRIPATKVTGKWLFPKHLIDEWIEMDAKKGFLEAREKGRKIEGALLASGSNDPIIDMLYTYMKRINPNFYIFSANTGSANGLKALNAGLTDIAYSHLFDPEKATYNIPFLSEYLPDIKPVVVHLFKREIGLVCAKGNPFNIKGFQDLLEKRLRFINRQKGSGTRIFIDHILNQLNIKEKDIKGYENEVYTHFEVGIAVLSGEADCGVATSAISKLFNLHFIPLAFESFDMILDQSTFFKRPVQTFIEALSSKNFKSMVEKIGNYDFTSSGKILYFKE